MPVATCTEFSDPRAKLTRLGHSIDGRRTNELSAHLVSTVLKSGAATVFENRGTAQVLALRVICSLDWLSRGVCYCTDGERNSA